jgi:UDP-N-acetylglucosamine 1-carboxyvinyltransferase
MAKFFVEGGNPIQGTIRPAGNKNEALPVLAATLLTSQKVKLFNVPCIGDVESLLGLLEICGAEIERTSDGLFIHAEKIEQVTLPFSQCQKIRASILLLAPLLLRCGVAEIPFPGGDRIGRRRVDTHLFGLEALGAKFELTNDSYRVWIEEPLKGAEILLDEASVTATENIVMTAAMAEGQTIIQNAACEPHVQQLCHYLNNLGADIAGIGSNILTINGVSSLNGGEHTIAADYLEVGSFIGLAVVTGGELLIQDAAPEYMPMILHRFKRLGINVEIRNNDIFVPKDQTLEIVPDLHTSLVEIDDGPWPQFPADMMSIAVVVATQTKGTVMIFEKMFESRLFFVDRLNSMGANIILCDPHRAVVVGPTNLQRRIMSSPDIRAGMALLTAALCAEGTSEIQNIEQIDRGYERLDERLSKLGAVIRRED